MRWDRPVHDYVTTGLGLSFYSNKPEGEFRDPGFDVALHLKGRYPFEIGKTERKFESEVYLLFEIGFTIWIDSAASFNLMGPGWTVGLAPGYPFFSNKRGGLLAEVVWIRTQAFYARGRRDVLVNQAAVRIGAIFPF